MKRKVSSEDRNATIKEMDGYYLHVHSRYKYNAIVLPISIEEVEEGGSKEEENIRKREESKIKKRKRKKKGQKDDVQPRIRTETSPNSCGLITSDDAKAA